MTAMEVDTVGSRKSTRTRKPVKTGNEFVWTNDRIDGLTDKGFLDAFDPTMTKKGDRIAIQWDNQWWPATCESAKGKGVKRKWMVSFDSQKGEQVEYQFTADSAVAFIPFIEAAIEEEENAHMSKGKKKKRTAKKGKKKSAVSSSEEESSSEGYDLEADMKDLDMSDEEEYESDDASESDLESGSGSDESSDDDDSSSPKSKAKPFVNPKKRKTKSALKSMKSLTGDVDMDAKSSVGKCKCVSSCPKRVNTSGIYLQSIEIGSWNWSLPSVNLGPVKYPEYSFIFENVDGHYSTTSINLIESGDTVTPEFTELQFCNFQANHSARELYYIIFDTPSLTRCVIPYSSIKCIHRGYRLGGRCFCLETNAACEWEEYTPGYGWQEMDDPTNGESSTNGLHILTFARMPRYVQQILSRMIMQMKKQKFKVAVNQLEYNNETCESIFPTVSLGKKKSKRAVKKSAKAKTGRVSES